MTNTNDRLARIRAGGAIGVADAEWLLGEFERLQRDIYQFKEAIYWALGERGDFPDRPSGSGPWYWRTELRKRSGLPVNGRPIEPAVLRCTCIWFTRDGATVTQHWKDDRECPIHGERIKATTEGLTLTGLQENPPHTTEDDFQHFLSYEQLSRQPAEELDHLRRAYYAGADAPPPPKAPEVPLSGCSWTAPDGTYRSWQVGTPFPDDIPSTARERYRGLDGPVKSAIVQGADFVLAPPGETNSTPEPWTCKCGAPDCPYCGYGRDQR